MSVYNGTPPSLWECSLKSTIWQKTPYGFVKLYLAVDGPLSDEHWKVLERYRKLIYRVIILPNNVGLASALNFLIDQLEPHDEYVFRVDADDINDLDRFTQQVEYLDDHPEVEILGGAVHEYASSHNGNYIYRGERSFPSTELVMKTIGRASPLAHPTVCFRATFFKDGTRYPTLRCNEDIALWFNALAKGAIIDNLKTPLVSVMQSSNFLERRGWKKAREEFVIYKNGTRKLGRRYEGLIYAVARFLLRAGPRFLSNCIYNSVAFRNYLGDSSKPQ